MASFSLKIRSAGGTQSTRRRSGSLVFGHACTLVRDSSTARARLGSHEFRGWWLCRWLQVQGVCRAGPRGPYGALPPASLVVDSDQEAWVRRVALGVEGARAPGGLFLGCWWCLACCRAPCGLRVGLALPRIEDTFLFPHSTAAASQPQLLGTPLSPRMHSLPTPHLPVLQPTSPRGRSLPLLSVTHGGRLKINLVLVC